MPVATFSFSEDPGHTMEVRWSPFGYERYLLDGQLLAKRWNFSFSGERIFQVDGKQLRFVVRYSSRDYYSKVFWDDKLIVPELFPDIAKKLQSARIHRGGWRRFVIRLVIWLVVGFVGMYAYNYHKSQQTAFRDCPKPRTVATNAQSCS